MNVLHFHLSDQCRFSVESKLFPEVTSKLVGAQAGHYTQNDIRDIVAYAGDRGIRVRAIILSIRTSGECGLYLTPGSFRVLRFHPYD